MATSAAIFRPYTDNFGQLTLNATMLGGGSTTATHDHTTRINSLIILAFLLCMIMIVTGIYTADKALFAQHSHQTGVYTGMALDYD